MIDVTRLFCTIDDFWKRFKTDWNKHLIESKKQKRGPKSRLSTSEMMTIVVMFHQSGYRCFKNYYGYVSTYLKSYFPSLVSYDRFVHLKKSLFIPLFAYLLEMRGEITGVAFVDATSLAVCHNKRISRNKVFRGIAKRGKTTTGWFYGFKLHLILNEKGEILAFQLTAGNISDISVLETLSKGIWGKLYGDKGYISSKIAKNLYEKGLELITTIRSNMKQKLLSIRDKILLRKRSIIETVNDQLKNISQIEHSRHRSPCNFLVNLLSGLVAYMHQPKKPSLNLDNKDMNQFFVC